MEKVKFHNPIIWAKGLWDSAVKGGMHSVESSAALIIGSTISSNVSHINWQTMLSFLTFGATWSIVKYLHSNPSPDVDNKCVKKKGKI